MTYWSVLAIFFFASATTGTISSHLGDHRIAMLHHLTLWTVTETRTQYYINTRKVAILSTVQEVGRRFLLRNIFKEFRVKHVACPLTALTLGNRNRTELLLSSQPLLSA